METASDEFEKLSKEFNDYCNSCHYVETLTSVNTMTYCFSVCLCIAKLNYI